MAKKAKAVSAIGDAVKAAASTSHPSSWADRYEFDPDSNSIRAKAGHEAPAFLQHVTFQKTGNGFSGHIPSLAASDYASSYGSMGMDDLEDYMGMWESINESQDGKCDIRKAIRYSKKDPLVQKCLTMLAQLANSTFALSSENDSAREVVDIWRKTAMPYSFMQQWFFEYFRSAYVPSLKTFIEYVPRELRPNKIPQPVEGNIEIRATGSETEEERAAATEALVTRQRQAFETYKVALATYEQAKELTQQGLCSIERLEKYEQAVSRTQYEWMKGTIPGAYTILDPLLVDMDGPKEMGLLRQPYLRLSGELHDAVMNPTPQMQANLSTLPMEIISQIRQNKEKIWLSPNVCNVTFGNKQPYERYPTPLTVGAFTALEMKDEMISMDKATARSVKNRILLVKLGTDQYPEFDPEKVKKVQKLLATPSRNMTLVWNHCIELEWIEPDFDSLKDTEKYKFWNSEIRTIFGISPVLTGTSETSGAIGNSIMNFKGVEELVTEAQQKFLEFFHREVKMLRSALSISADVIGSFDTLNMKDEVEFWGVMQTAVMNGLIDHQTALETLKFNFPTVKKRMEDMKKLKDKGLFMPIPSANNLGPGGQPLPNKGGTPGPLGGKPRNQPGSKKSNKNKVGKTQPKAVKAKAKIQPLGEDMVAIVVDMPDLDHDQQMDVADHFRVPFNWVMTKAAYEKEHGEIDMSPPWPSLSTAETIGVMREATSIAGKVNYITEQELLRYKTEHSKGKRAAYATATVKAEISTAAQEKVLSEWRATQIEGEIPKAWGRYMAEITSDLKKQFADMTPEEVFVAAWAVCTKRLQKSMKK
jgi:hypothetical protein